MSKIIYKLCIIFHKLNFDLHYSFNLRCMVVTNCQ